MTREHENEHKSKANNDKPIFKNQYENAHNLKLIPYKVWILVAAVAISLIGLLLWSIFGHVTTKVHARGILLPGESRIFYASSPRDGIIKNILVKRGEKVQKNQKLATLYTPILRKKIKQQQAYIKDLKNNRPPDQLSNAQKLQLAKARHHLAILILKYHFSHVIKSPVAGQVISITSHRGMLANSGKPIVLLGEKGKSLNAFVLFPAFKGKRVKPHMRAFISPTYVNQYQYGSIEGHVKDISPYPVSKRTILSVIGEKSWLSSLGFKGDAMFMGRVKLEHNQQTPSGFEWTSSQGPDMTVSAGSFVDVSVVVKRQAPITLVIPILRTWLNGEGS